MSNRSILTHWHHDHVGGVPFVLRMLDKLRKEAAPYAQVPVPRIFKFPEPVTDPSLFERVERVPLNAYLHVPGVDGPARMMWPLRDNMTIRVRDPEDPTRVTSVRALYTPGHAADHMMFLLEEDNILLTGDNVLGRGSTVFEDLILYMHGIQRGLSLLTMRPATPLGVVGTPMTGMSGENVLFPGHGPVIPKGKETLRRYLKHRVEREEQLLALLTCRPGDKERVNKAIAYPMEHIEAAQQGRAATHVWTLRQFVSALYENYALNMYPAVARVLLLHLQKLSVSPAEHKAPPFPTRQTVPSTAWALTGPLVRCASLPSFQRTSQPFPDLPSNDTEWREMLDLPWCLSAA
ncbi:secondary metabolite biosynthesis protein [Malassezia pachydermatis]